MTLSTIAFVATSALLLTHCPRDVFDIVNRQPQSAQAAFCDVMNQRGGPIRWSKNDTRLTKEQVDGVNAAGVRLCGWGKQ